MHDQTCLWLTVPKPWSYGFYCVITMICGWSYHHKVIRMASRLSPVMQWRVNPSIFSLPTFEIAYSLKKTNYLFFININSLWKYRLKKSFTLEVVRLIVNTDWCSFDLPFVLPAALHHCLEQGKACSKSQLSHLLLCVEQMPSTKHSNAIDVMHC